MPRNWNTRGSVCLGGATKALRTPDGKASFLLPRVPAGRRSSSPSLDSGSEGRLRGCRACQPAAPEPRGEGLSGAASWEPGACSCPEAHTLEMGNSAVFHRQQPLPARSRPQDSCRKGLPTSVRRLAPEAEPRWRRAPSLPSAQEPWARRSCQANEATPPHHSI